MRQTDRQGQRQKGNQTETDRDRERQTDRQGQRQKGNQT